MFKVHVKLTSQHLSKGSMRRQEFRQLKIIKDLGFKLEIHITKDWQGKRAREVSIVDRDKSREFIITDPTTIPEVLWTYFNSDYSLISLQRLRPLLFKMEDGYRIPTLSLKEWVHTPQVRIDHGLIQFDEVDWLEDACTQDLQDKLDEGWRIIACIPQVAQRRPDYVLGRTKKNETNS